MIREWVNENLHIRNFLQLSNVPSITVFYEDLAGSPTNEFQKLCADIGCLFEPSALRYWEKVHHGFAGNGASSTLLASAPHLSPSILVSGDDPFYATNDRKSFVDQRWKERLSEADALAISEDPRVAGFLKLYDRVLTADNLHRLTVDECALHRQLEGKFIRAPEDTLLEKIYVVRSGFRHWVTSMQFIERVSTEWPNDLEILPVGSLERVPMGAPVRG